MLADQKLRIGWLVATEHGDPTDPCGMRVNIRLTKNDVGDVRFQAVWIEYGAKFPEVATGEVIDGEFAIDCVLCIDAGLSYSTKVVTFLIQ